jgi:hypothetical protein
MKITKQQLKQIIKEELSKVMNESMPGMEPYDLSALVPKGEDPKKRAAAIKAGRDDFHNLGKLDDTWKKTRYYKYYKDAFYNAKDEQDAGFVDRMGE